MEESVVFGVGPERVVVAAVGDPHFEKGVRVDVVGDPAAAFEREVVGDVLSGEVNFPLFVAERDFYAEIFAPHLLDGFRDGAVIFGRVVEKLDRRAALPVRITRLSEQLLRFGDATFEFGPRHVAGRARITHGVGRRLTAAGHVLDQALAINRERKGLTHAFVREGCARDVAAVKIETEIGLDVQEFGVLLAVGVDFGVGQFVRLVELTRAKHAFFARDVLGGIELDGFQFHGGGVPVMGIRHERDALVGQPFLQHERGVADEIPGAGPGRVLLLELAEFFDHVHRHHAPCVVARDDFQQVGRGRVERDLKRAGIEGLETGLRKISKFSLGVIFRPDGEPEKIRILGGQRWREHALIGFDVLLRGDRRAVGPFGVGSQVKRVDQTVGGNLPAIGEACHGVQILGIFGYEPLEESHDDFVLGDAGDRLRVEILRLGAVAEA